MVDLSTIKTITDWRLRDADLPSLGPGETFERVIAPQKFVILLKIVVSNETDTRARGARVRDLPRASDLALVRVCIGAVDDVPFELENMDGSTRTYKPTSLDNIDLAKSLIMTGAAVSTKDSIAMAPGLEVRAVVRNEGKSPVLFRVALVVQEKPS